MSNHVGPIVFSDETARRQLEQHGEVVTFRIDERTTGHTWWRESRTGPKKGDCTVEYIGTADPTDRDALKPFRPKSGFRSVQAWQDAIADLNGDLVEGNLYRVTSEELWAECESCNHYGTDVEAIGCGPDISFLCSDCRPEWAKEGDRDV